MQLRPASLALGDRCSLIEVVGLAHLVPLLARLVLAPSLQPWVWRPSLQIHTSPAAAPTPARLSWHQAVDRVPRQRQHSRKRPNHRPLAPQPALYLALLALLFQSLSRAPRRRRGPVWQCQPSSRQPLRQRPRSLWASGVCPAASFATQARACSVALATVCSSSRQLPVALRRSLRHVRTVARLPTCANTSAPPSKCGQAFASSSR